MSETRFECREAIKAVVAAIGTYKDVAKVCGVNSPESIRKWIVAGHLPRTDYTGETNYASILINAAKRGHGIKKRDLLPRLGKF